MSEEDYLMLQGCARFYRACFYSRICMLYGDPVMFLNDITLEEAYTIGRTPLLEALPKIMEDFDFVPHVGVDIEYGKSWGSFKKWEV